MSKTKNPYSEFTQKATFLLCWRVRQHCYAVCYICRVAVMSHYLWKIRKFLCIYDLWSSILGMIIVLVEKWCLEATILVETEQILLRDRARLRLVSVEGCPVVYEYFYLWQSVCMCRSEGNLPTVFMRWFLSQCLSSRGIPPMWTMPSNTIFVSNCLTCHWLLLI